MAQRFWELKGCKGELNGPKSIELPKLVLVGTYKEAQLDWTRRVGIYNYPVKPGDNFSEQMLKQVCELWLYADNKGSRYAFRATFEAKMSASAFLEKYSDYIQLGKPKCRAYYVFKVKSLSCGSSVEGRKVFVRIADFGCRTTRFKRAIEQFKTYGEFVSLIDYLPIDLAVVPINDLWCYEMAVQKDALNSYQIDKMAYYALRCRAIMQQAKTDHHLTCVEICAGAGGQAIGLERAGFAHVALVEYEREYCDVLRKNNPKWNVICADVRQFDGRPYEGVDLLAGGVPCPPFSVASKQLGEQDERDLFPEAIRLIGEIKPKAVMLENVRGFLDPKFDAYRTSILQRIETLGYDVQIKLLQASDFGVPQIRPRVVIVGIKKSLGRTFDYPTGQTTSAPTVGEALGKLMGANGWRGVEKWKQQANTIAPTIVGGSKKHGGPDLGPTRARRAWAALSVDGLGIANEPPARDFEGMPRLTKEMMAVLQGFPKEWDFGKKKTVACRMIGNAFPPPVAMAVGQQIMRCISNEA